MSGAGISLRASAYDITVYPDDIECAEARAFTLTVAYRGGGGWAITRAGRCMNAGGELSAEPPPDARTGEWLSAHRFTCHDALRIAYESAPHLRAGDVTAAEALARHLAAYPDGCPGWFHPPRRARPPADGPGLAEPAEGDGPAGLPAEDDDESESEEEPDGTARVGQPDRRH